MDAKNTFSVYKTVIEMFKDRGYSISRNIGLDEFITMYDENNYDIVDDEEKIMAAFFSENKTISKKDLENIVLDAKEDYGNDIKIVIIMKNKPNINIEKELMNDVYKNIELFLFKNLTFNITRHVDMPQHIPLSPKEIAEVVEKYKTNKNQFPKMLTTDPIARYYGVSAGGMFKIIRKSQSSGEYISYRYVK